MPLTITTNPSVLVNGKAAVVPQRVPCVVQASSAVTEDVLGPSTATELLHAREIGRDVDVLQHQHYVETFSRARLAVAMGAGMEVLLHAVGAVMPDAPVDQTRISVANRNLVVQMAAMEAMTGAQATQCVKAVGRDVVVGQLPRCVVTVPVAVQEDAQVL